MRISKVVRNIHGETLFTEAAAIDPDGSLFSRWTNLWDKIIGNWTAHKRVFAFTLSDGDMLPENGDVPTLDNQGVLHFSNEVCREESEQLIGRYDDLRVRKNFKYTVSVYIFSEKNERFDFDQQFDVPVDEQI